VGFDGGVAGLGTGFTLAGLNTATTSGLAATGLVLGALAPERTATTAWCCGDERRSGAATAGR
jgi:hypothetical protein